MVNLRNTFHHLISNLVVTSCPDINNLIVFLALGNQTILILFFKLFGLFRSFFNQLFLSFWYNQVIFTKRDTCFTSVFKTQSHDFINHDTGFFLSAITINRINDFTDFFFTQKSVHQRNRNFLIVRQNIGNDDTAWCCFKQSVNTLAVIIDIMHTALNLSMQINSLGI